MFEAMLSGGDKRSLGRADEVVAHVLAKPKRVAALYDCLFSDDEIVRMRASDALEKVCRERPALVMPFADRLLRDVAKIDQPSVQWHLAQILGTLPLDAALRRRAIAHLKRNLRRYDDWIVINLTLEALAEIAKHSASLRKTLPPILRRYQRDRRKSVAKRASKLLAGLS